MASRCWNGCSFVFRVIVTCECCFKEKPKSAFPFLFFYTFVVNVSPLIPSVILTWMFWNNNCSQPWEVYLLIYCILFTLNCVFGWYLNFRFYYMKVKERDKGACERACSMLCHDIGMCIFALVWIGELAWNISIGILYSQDSDCMQKSPSLFTMARVAWVFLFAFLVGVILFAFITVCYECCCIMDSSQRSTNTERPNEEKPIENESISSKDNSIENNTASTMLGAETHV